MRRFYALTLTPTLFGAWAIVREWGRIAQPGKMRESWFTSESEAMAAGPRTVRRKERRGYVGDGQVMASGKNEKRNPPSALGDSSKSERAI